MNAEQLAAGGFESEEEYVALIVKVNVATAERLADFQRWQKNDGSRDGLRRLVALSEQERRIDRIQMKRQAGVMSAKELRMILKRVHGNLPVRTQCEAGICDVGIVELVRDEDGPYILVRESPGFWIEHPHARKTR